MKTIQKVICMLLVLVMALSIIPMTAAAGEDGKEQETKEEKVPTATVTLALQLGGKYTLEKTYTVADKDVELKADFIVEYKGRLYERTSRGTFDIPAYDGTDTWKGNFGYINVKYKVHTHNFTLRHNRLSHWMGCSCGQSYDKESHVDPATDADKICTCGYQFSSNADLTTLWLTNIRFDRRFAADITEYNASTVTYYDVTETDITAASCDALATIAFPEDTTIHDGNNRFQITVTAEDKTTTKTYTVNVSKPIKVAGLLLTSDGTSISAEPKTTTLYRIATAKVPELLVEDMAELAVKDGCKQLTLAPDHSKWASDQLDVPIAAGVLRDIAAETDLTLYVRSHFGTVTIPNDDLAKLAENCETLTISFVRETSIELLAGGEKITDLPEGIDRDLF